MQYELFRTPNHRIMIDKFIRFSGWQNQEQHYGRIIDKIKISKKVRIATVRGEDSYLPVTAYLVDCLDDTIRIVEPYCINKYH